MGIIKNNHNYMVQIITFLEDVQIIHGISLLFLKPYISKLCNDFSYIFDLEFHWIYIFWFLHPIIHLP